jgi:uncharacterized repeat protein (TIGR03803 family)
VSKTSCCLSGSDEPIEWVVVVGASIIGPLNLAESNTIVIDLKLSRNLAVGPRAGGLFAALMLGSLLTVTVPAQTLTTLHGFTAYSGLNYHNGDGAFPAAGLIANSSRDILYGTASAGGGSGLGTVFKLNTDGTGFAAVYSFSGTSVASVGFPAYTNRDGANPTSGLILSGATLYGTAEFGGSSGHGTVFKVNTDGTGFTILHNFSGIPSADVSTPFTNSDGGFPTGGLILSGNTLYGTAGGGGSSGSGTVFAVNTDGTGFTMLHAFAAFVGFPYNTNTDGLAPQAALVLSGNTLYGTALQGGHSNGGTVFAVNTDGTSFTVLHHFNPGDGILPYGTLILSSNILYGTTAAAGSSGNGTVFALNTDGTGFRTLHVFTATADNGNGINTNSDGTTPYAGLIVSGHTLYGAAGDGGSHGAGTMFALNSDGTGFRTLHSFTRNDGLFPTGALILLGSSLYATAQNGGGSGNGTVVRLAFPPSQLTINVSGANVILTWPINYAGFDYSGFTLQSATNLSSSAWTTNLPLPVVVNGQYTVTNSISGSQEFFRLIQ